METFDMTGCINDFCRKQNMGWKLMFFAFLWSAWRLFRPPVICVVTCYEKVTNETNKKLPATFHSYFEKTMLRFLPHAGSSKNLKMIYD